ncbi:hypothetical protein P4O66_016470 [Electrophorus voltai]|uniref:Serine/threonine-protein phosphatase 2A 55 kDa regulatory subunit B n=1 Tax=Electrophorus voltai TaxID=2609070 RepID=A0AAD8YWE9_9TELE|nr:hypothetical protein P4O66_016470 [Electrophorus voltai]
MSESMRSTVAHFSSNLCLCEWHGVLCGPESDAQTRSSKKMKCFSRYLPYLFRPPSTILSSSCHTEGSRMFSASADPHAHTMRMLSASADLQAVLKPDIPAAHVLNFYALSPPADIISTVEFNSTGELLATGDKGGRVVVFQREQEFCLSFMVFISGFAILEHDNKTVKLWKISERDKRPEGYNLKDEDGRVRDPSTITALRVPVLRPMDLMVEATPRRVFSNAHTYHINSISVNSDYETYMSTDDLRINLWNLEITNRSFNIVDIKPANMEELTEVITAAEFHPNHCNTFVYSSSKGSLRLCDMRAAALCDNHSKFFEEPEDPNNRSFFSEIISSISDVKFSHSGRYLMTRDYLTVKVWDLNMESKPLETYQVHDYLRSKMCSLYENDCIFDKFECVWNGTDSVLMTGSYNNFFRMFDRNTKRDVTLEASRENSKPRAILKPRKVCMGGKRRKDEISVDSLDFSKKILHTAWHPSENIIAVAATNNLYIFQDKVN